MDSELLELKNHVCESLGAAINGAEISYGELTINARREEIVGTIQFLRDNPLCRFTTLVDICGADYPERERRFDIVYHLLSMHLNHRVRVKINTDAQTPVKSILSVFPAANWYEREAYDMYGIAFEDHPDLRRLLTDYGFEGHPLRKDFPLSGFVEVRYDEEQKQVVYETVCLPQEYRDFDFMSPWEGAQYVPRDEKAEGS